MQKRNILLILTLLGLTTFVFQNCSPNAPLSSSNGNDQVINSTPTPSPTCSISEKEAELNAAMAAATTDENPFPDFSFLIERGDGKQFIYNRGSSTLDTSYESASTSKWISAVIILRLVDKGILSLNDKPQDYIPGWPITSGHPLYSMTLRHLLSFTSGLTEDHFCTNNPSANFFTCVTNVANANASNTMTPGTEFFYSGSHLLVAGAMAIKAYGKSSWQDLFTEFKTETGLFPTSAYDLPSLTNPRLAGGMHWTGNEYFAFIKAFKNGSLLSATLMNEMLTDQIASASIVFSPIAVVNQVWHYGFGSWQECQDSLNYSCASGTRISSPGAYGAYPFWDRAKNYFGILARQGELGTFRKGVELENPLRPYIEAWVNCN